MSDASFTIELPVTLIFKSPSLVVLQCGDKAFELSKIDTVDELRLLLYGLATGALEALTAKSTVTPSAPSQTESVAAMADAFRKQADDARTRLNQETAHYEATIAGLAKDS